MLIRPLNYMSRDSKQRTATCKRVTGQRKKQVLSFNHGLHFYLYFLSSHPIRGVKVSSRVIHTQLNVYVMFVLMSLFISVLPYLPLMKVMWCVGGCEWRPWLDVITKVRPWACWKRALWQITWTVTLFSGCVIIDQCNPW
jgi:hypothetical protein